jgi:hypothetical protein
MTHVEAFSFASLFFDLYLRSSFTIAHIKTIHRKKGKEG